MVISKRFDEKERLYFTFDCLIIVTRKEAFNIEIIYLYPTARSTLPTRPILKSAGIKNHFNEKAQNVIKIFSIRNDFSSPINTIEASTLDVGLQ